MKKNTKWTLLILLIFLIWGSFYPVSKSILSDIHPLLLAFLRYLFALIPMFPFVLLESHRRRKNEAAESLTPRDIGSIIFLGLLGVTGFSVFLFYGIKLSSSMLSSILTNTQAIFVALLAPLIINEAFPRRQLPGILLGFVGMALVVSSGGTGGIGIEGSKVLGNILCILASISISFYYMLMKSKVQKYGSLIPTFISFAAGGSVLLILAVIAGADFSVLSRSSVKDWIFIAYNGIIATAFVYVVHNRAILEIGVIRTIRLKFLIPVFGVLLSIIFLGERTGTLTWIGIIVVMVATIIIQAGDHRGQN